MGSAVQLANIIGDSYKYMSSPSEQSASVLHSLAVVFRGRSTTAESLGVRLCISQLVFRTRHLHPSSSTHHSPRISLKYL